MKNKDIKINFDDCDSITLPYVFNDLLKNEVLEMNPINKIRRQKYIEKEIERQKTKEFWLEIKPKLMDYWLEYELLKQKK